jgi:ubiquinone/menaquinone biosynthesis C-methylase UbiE
VKRDKEAEVATDFLENRILSNEKVQKKDLNKWIFENLDVTHHARDILELCCGTGKQTELLLQIKSCESLTAIDASQDSIKFISEQSFYDAARMNLVQSDMDGFLSGQGCYDLIFCAYGLYYSRDANALLDELYAHLNPRGSLVIVGPYGSNNMQLFELLRSCGITIGELVLQSSSLFMANDVLQHGIKNYPDLNVRTMINPVCWDTKEDVMRYWKNSTFYDSDKEDLVEAKLERNFEEHEYFINEKHIMFMQMIKDAE